MLNYDAKITPNPVLGKGHYLVHITVSAPELSEQESASSILTINYLLDVGTEMEKYLNILWRALANSISKLADGSILSVILFTQKALTIVDKQTKTKNLDELAKSLAPLKILKNFHAKIPTLCLSPAFRGEIGVRILITNAKKSLPTNYLLEKIENEGGVVEEIYTIGIGEDYDQTLLDDLAKETGTQHSWHIRDANDIDPIFKKIHTKLGKKTRPITVMATINNNTSAHSIGSLGYGQHGISFTIPVNLPVDNKKVELTLIDNLFSNTTIILDLENAAINEKILIQHASSEMVKINTDISMSYQKQMKIIKNEILPCLINNKLPLAQEILKKIQNNIQALERKNKNEIRHYTSEFNEISHGLLLTDEVPSKNSLPSANHFSNINSEWNPSSNSNSFKLEQEPLNPNPFNIPGMDHISSTLKTLLGVDLVLWVSNFDAESKDYSVELSKKEMFDFSPYLKCAFDQKPYLRIRSIENCTKLINHIWKVDGRLIFIINNIGYLRHPYTPHIQNPYTIGLNILRDRSKNLDTKLNELLTFTSKTLFPKDDIDSVYKTYSNNVALVHYEDKIIPCISINRFINAKVGTDSIRAFFIMYCLSKAASWYAYLPPEYEIYWYPSWVILKTNESLYLIGSTKIYNLSSPETLKQATQHYTTSPYSEQIFKECLARFNLDLPEKSTLVQQEILTNEKNKNTPFEEQKTNVEEITPDDKLKLIEKSILTQQGVFANKKNKHDTIKKQKTIMKEINADGEFEILQIDSLNKGKKPS